MKDANTAGSNPSVQDMKARANDLDWFSFENRIRTTVHQLIDPLKHKLVVSPLSLFRIKTDEAKFDKIIAESDLQKERIEELEFLSHKT